MGFPQGRRAKATLLLRNVNGFKVDCFGLCHRNDGLSKKQRKVFASEITNSKRSYIFASFLIKKEVAFLVLFSIEKKEQRF